MRIARTKVSASVMKASIPFGNFGTMAPLIYCFRNTKSAKKLEPSTPADHELTLVGRNDQGHSIFGIADDHHL